MPPTAFWLQSGQFAPLARPLPLVLYAHDGISNNLSTKNKTISPTNPSPQTSSKIIKRQNRNTSNPNSDFHDMKLFEYASDSLPVSLKKDFLARPNSHSTSLSTLSNVFDTTLVPRLFSLSLQTTLELSEPSTC